MTVHKSIPDAVYVEYEGEWHRLPIDPDPPYGITNACDIPEEVVRSAPLTTETPKGPTHSCMDPLP